jgi:hypothetical protein
MSYSLYLRNSSRSRKSEATLLPEQFLECLFALPNDVFAALTF